MVELRIETERHSQLVDITRLEQNAVAGERGAAVLVYVPHTTAGVTINEHADPAVARDFETALERIVPSNWAWQHVEEGEENDLVGEQFLYWFLQEQREEVASMSDLLAVVERATELNLLLVEDYLARTQIGDAGEGVGAPPAAGGAL